VEIMKNVVGIHQPGYLPWAGFFFKMALSDTFVFYDDVKFEHGGFTNKNRIRTQTGEQWLTVPVHLPQGRDTLIDEVEIDNSHNWKKKHQKSIELNYRKAKNFERVWPLLEDRIGNWFYLHDLNESLIYLFCVLLNIKPHITHSSNFNIKSTGSDKILEICKELKATEYVTGTSWALDNLKLKDFEREGILVKFLDNPRHKPYQQIYSPYIQGLSELDYIMCGNY
jgi:hypothetical protein